MKRYAIILATDEYSQLPLHPTPYCHDDATLLKETLVNRCDYAEQDIVLTLLSPAVAAEPMHLLTQIEELTAKTQAGDSILFYYAGHGTVEGDEPYLVLPSTDPRDLVHTGLALRDVSSKLRLPQRVCVRIFDACHSGYDVRDATLPISTDSAGFLRAVVQSREQGWLTFAACQADEYSHPDAELAHGIFTHSFCEAVREFGPDQDVAPELLKVRTCDKVAEWCVANGKQQTPTFNCSIAGNIILFHTSAQASTSDTNKNASAASDDLIDSDEIRSRIASVRSAGQFDDVGRTKRLAEIASQLHSYLEVHMLEIETYGCNIRLSQLLSPTNLATDFKKRIVRIVENEKVHPLHDIRTVEKRSNDNIYDVNTMAALGYNPIMNPVRSTIEYSYEVTQKSPWPNSYVDITIKTDGLLPSGILLFYLIPLQIRAILYCGIACNSKPHGEEASYEWENYEFIDLFDQHTFLDTEAVVAEALAKLNEVFSKRVDDRLNYLNQELAK